MTTEYRWADEDLDESAEDGSTETGPDENGVKIITTITTQEDGSRTKTVKKVKVVKKVHKINKSIEARKAWTKFGDARTGDGRGNTAIGEEVFLELKAKSKQTAQEKVEKELVPMGIVCRACNKVGDHWTSKCPYKDRLVTPTDLSSRTLAEDNKAAPAKPGAPAAAAVVDRNKYLPPSMRGAAGRDSGDRYRRDETATIRVTNLSEETREQDLHDLFRGFGNISRVYLAKDKNTGLSKGFAFINFVHREDAARAIEKLSGYGYDHLILHVEWAKPSAGS
eukprot:TRINITY_DN1467_c0_g1_i1.p1 TRINITY_DN1467_c0_g1~~TRINITY_DN1467_c0_g1_i1.p1  ORF type:complete len:307 (+),score=91.39 TRINITY_DN1467_c0_g1_i1:83-922(+)